MRGSYVVETRAICRFTISIYLPSNVKNMGFADVRFGFFFTKKMHKILPQNSRNLILLIAQYWLFYFAKAWIGGKIRIIISISP
ncbi:hypothetical protein RIR_jg32128.t1 [Rhizophagus irregularis DAOM 181602=DAOM 197198]|nr:hypothetical protein RIR_jg32128.t1 [Rhizophagus irregularis DAOM 181602=DAOM 197198]